ncbi:MAG: TatD family hydrolase [Candidatus Aenigmatarchaeota archaeon]
MIDSHCHLEQQDYQLDRDDVIANCKKELKAVITCCANHKDFDLTMQIVERHKGFVFATVSIHPIHIEEIEEKDAVIFFDLVRKNRDKIVGIGETGLDFKIENEESREKQKKLFIGFIKLSKELNLPLVIHARQAFKEAVDILEEYNARNVLMHFFTAKELLPRIIANDWYISVNTTLSTSKNIKKIVRDIPLERILTETDAPWLGPEGTRNTPLSVKLVVEKIADIKKKSFEEVDRITTENAISFFKL